MKSGLHLRHKRNQVGDALCRATLMVGLLSTGVASAQGNVPLSQWMSSEEDIARDRMAANIHPDGTPKGFVVASPSQNNPDYYYNWTRDAALTMTVVGEIALQEPAGDQRSNDFAEIADYVAFSHHLQHEDTVSGHVADHYQNSGEPKFNPDGTGYSGDWGRPQTDGPALRAIALLRFMEGAYNADGSARIDDPAITPQLYTAMLNVIDADLEYVLYHGNEISSDIWEETKGHHFYNALVQRRALLLGASAAKDRGDNAKASNYSAMADTLTNQLEDFWDDSRGYLVETRDGDLGRKQSNLDTAVLLAVIHAYDASDDDFGPQDDRVLATVYHLKDTFHRLYPINSVARSPDGELLGTALGRYEEDLYDGGSNSGGNPWFLITLGMAEFDYRLTEALNSAGQITITARNLAFYKSLPGVHQTLSDGTVLTRGDAGFTEIISALVTDAQSYFARVRYHTDADGRLWEQFDRSTGYTRSAVDLTWSYASYLSAYMCSQEDDAQ